MAPSHQNRNDQQWCGISDSRRGQASPSWMDQGCRPYFFDVKMYFTRKARFVLDGHTTPNPIESTYPGVVSHESVKIAFTYATLNGLNVFAGDIHNAYVQKH